MIKITASFCNASYLDFALGEIKNKYKIKKVTINEKELSTQVPINYPVSPEYADTTSYLDGQPHILSDALPSSEKNEINNDKPVTISFYTENKYRTNINTILLKYKAYDITLSY